MLAATTLQPFGPHHCRIRSGSVKQAHKGSRGTSNSREMTKSLVCSGMCAFLFDEDHPVHAELVGEHPEAGRKESLAKRHDHLAAFGKRVEHARGVGLGLRIERQ